jgi:hypothetical protein
MAKRDDVQDYISDILYEVMDEAIMEVQCPISLAAEILKEIEKHMIPVSLKKTEDLYGNVRYKSVYEWED